MECPDPSKAQAADIAVADTAVPAAAGQLPALPALPAADQGSAAAACYSALPDMLLAAQAGASSSQAEIHPLHDTEQSQGH